MLACRKLKSSMLTPENTDLIKQSIFTLIYTLKNIEVCPFHVSCTVWYAFLELNDMALPLSNLIQSISSDISGFTGDETTRRNIKLLIKSLSRLL